uniref:KAP NTPase domain-containing protein n=1 Tax=Eptatretus burgeri TaxID=7764 RepID=A0A8C4QM77_EPTBU
ANLTDTATRFTPTSYDHFACSLAKSLCYVTTPVTVGLFSRWGSGVKLHNTNRPRSDGTLPGLLHVIFRLMFFEPVIVDKYRNVRFITVKYSAWDYAGSDKLWAGIMTTLCEAVQKNFHPLTIGTDSVSLHSFFDFDFSEWRAKHVLCVIPLWLYWVFLLSLSLIVAILASILGFPTQCGVMVMTLESIGIGVASISGIVALKKLLPIVYNLIVSQKKFIEKLLNKTDFSAQLGFMKKVKEEIQIITNFVHFMEVFERRRIRIVLEITDLDCCGSEKIIRVLEAMRTLLSDEEARFISILAVDSNVIERAMGDCIANKGTTDKNGYEVLNHIVDLPLCIPLIDSTTKLQMLQKLIHGEQENIHIYEYMLHEHVTIDSSGIIMNGTLNNSNNIAKQVGKVKVGDFINLALQHLQNKEQLLFWYLETNFVKIRRAVNIIPVFINLLAQHNVIPKVHCLTQTIVKDESVNMAAWVVLASQWPCRLSWIIHWTERLPQWNVHYESGRLVVRTSAESYRRLKMLHTKMEPLLMLDGDPNMFKSFLKNHYVFIVDDIKRFYPATINLDPALKQKLEVARGRYNFEKCRTEMMAPKELRRTVCFMLSMLQRKHEEPPKPSRYNSEILTDVTRRLKRWKEYSEEFLSSIPRKLADKLHQVDRARTAISDEDISVEPASLAEVDWAIIKVTLAKHWASVVS